MALTPEEVRNKQFTTVRLREGYDEDEVDAFLDEIEAELARLLSENDELRQRAASGPAAASSTPTPTAPAGGPSPVPTAVPTPVAFPAVVTQTETAPLPVQNTAAPAEAAARVLELAQRTADELLAQSRAEADRLLAEAQSKVQSTDRDAQLQRAALEARVEDLRNFEREYRTRMRGYFENQLRELEARGSDPAAGLEPPTTEAIAAGLEPPTTEAIAAAVPVAAPALAGPAAQAPSPAPTSFNAWTVQPTSVNSCAGSRSKLIKTDQFMLDLMISKTALSSTHAVPLTGASSA
ncbi:MAG: DivIVA domain-containing protein [Actinobacteria bacterium]|nr:DivIVA domain-containing protein [Actinomycetota bacterium]